MDTYSPQPVSDNRFIPKISLTVFGNKNHKMDDDIHKSINTSSDADSKHYHGPGSTPDCLDTEVITKLYQLIVPTTFTLIILLGVIGNILVIYVILSRRKLQTVTNLLLLNLAISDVSFLLICGGFSVVHYVMTEWPLGDELCRITQYLLYVTCYVTVYTLIAVSAVRYITVIYGSKSSFIRSKQNVIILIVAIWAVFMIAKIPILVVHGVSYNLHSGRTECIIVGKADGQKLFASFFAFAYALPLLFICTLYLLILKHIRDKKTIGVNGSSPYSGRKKHVTKVVIIVVATFAICWLPLHLHLLVAYYGKVPETITYKILLILWQALSFVNSMLNPIIYNYIAKDFRDAFRDIICCCLRSRNMERVPTNNNNIVTTGNNGGFGDVSVHINRDVADEIDGDEHGAGEEREDSEEITPANV